MRVAQASMRAALTLDTPVTFHRHATERDN